VRSSVPGGLRQSWPTQERSLRQGGAPGQVPPTAAGGPATRLAVHVADPRMGATVAALAGGALPVRPRPADTSGRRTAESAGGCPCR
jgi:hypothetical protein